MADGLFSGGAAFGVFPQMQPRRRLQDPEAAANVPLSVLRGYAAGTAGLPGDIEGLFRSGLSQVPTEFFTAFPALRAFGIGSSANPTPQFPTTEFYNEYLPGAELNQTPLGKAFTSAGNLLGGVGSTNIAGLGVKGAKATGQALGPTAGRITEGYLQRQGLMPNIVPEAPKNLFGGPIEKPQAPVSELGFYSAAEQAALNLPRKSGTGESFLNDLMKGQDVKKDELSWMGLDDYLKGKPNVTRQEVQDFIASNRVDVQERQLGAAVAEDPVGIAQRKAVFDKYEPEIQDLYRRIDKPEYVVYDPETNKVLKNYTNYDDALLDNLNPMGAFSKARTGLRPKENSRQLQAQLTDLQTARDAEANAAYVIPEPTPTRYQNYQLPGGENYREILLTLPNKPMEPSAAAKLYYENYKQRGGEPNWSELPVEARQSIIDSMPAAVRNASGVPEYSSSHFNEPNILAHMRVNDRVDADGKKMLLIEEIQSDWHQAGREKGYNTPEKRAAEQKKLDDLIVERQQLGERQKQLEELASPYTSQGKDAPTNILDEWNSVSNRLQRLQTEQNRLGRTTGDGVPDAPFKDTWHQLALKRALKYAADNGYDRVGLTTGRQQADRYQLSKQISEVHYSGTNFKAYDLDGNEAISRTGVKPEDLAGLIGKEPAKKLLEQPKQGTLQSLTGQNLDVGGEGMKKYYDEIYPAFLAKQGKKYNAKTGETRIKTGQGIPGGAPVRYIDISPEMKGGVKKGQPLFTAAPIGGIGVGAGMQDNEMPEAVRQYMADPRYSDPFADPIR